MELSTVNLDGAILDVYYELTNNDIVLKSVEFLRNPTNLLGSLSKKDINQIIEILNEDNPLEVDNDGKIFAKPMFDIDLYESGHNARDFG